MNKERRKALSTLAEEVRQLIGYAEDLISQIETIRDEEQEYYDNMPEGIQSGEKGDAAQAAIDTMDEVISALQEVTQMDGDALENIE